MPEIPAGIDPDKIKYTPPVFPDQTQPNGALLPDIGCQACWYYYTLAHKSMIQVGKSIDDQFGLLEGDPWLDKHYVDIARSVAAIYGLKDPSEYMQYFPVVARECHRLKMTPPAEEYMKPLKLARI